MTDHRALAAASLMQGGASAVPAALRHAREFLQTVGAPAPVVAYPLLHPLAAIGAKGVTELRVHEDAAIASTARLTEGIEQYVHWAEPYRPPALRVFSMQRATAIAPNVIVTADGKLLDDNIGFSNAELCNHMPADFNGIVAGRGHIIMAVRHRDVARVNEPVIYLPAVGNYAAWLFGVLPRLIAFEAERDLPILLHGDVAAFHRDSLRAMGVAEQRLRIHRASVRVECKALYYCTSSYVHHAPSATGVRHVRESVTATLVPGEAKRIYLARRHAKDRPLINENEVIALFEKHGFIAIDPEQHSFEDQVRYATGAEIVAGPYGANLANLVFASNAQKLLILATKQQPEFARLAGALNVAFWHAIPQAVQLREGRTFSESFGFSADLVQLKRVVDSMLAS